jgi:hypothetical protein
LGTSIASIYRKVGAGELEMVKRGRSSLITVQSMKAEAASLPKANIKPAT